MNLGLLQKEVWNNTDADDCDYCDGPTFNRRHTSLACRSSSRAIS